MRRRIMASTVGHALCGISCLLGVSGANPGRPIPLTLRSAALFMLLANLPDIDFLVGYIVAQDPNAFHQGPTHSLLFAMVAGLLAGFAWRKQLGLRLASVAFTAAVLSHDVVDILTGPILGFVRSPGLALLWPFSTEKISAPFTLFPGILHLTFGELVSWHNMTAIAFELAVFIPIIVLLYKWKAKMYSNRENSPV